MNKNNAAAYLPLVQALAEGKTIQQCGSKQTLPKSEGRWIECWLDLTTENISFDMPPENYRIKPEEDYWGKSNALVDNISLAKEENKLTRKLLDKTDLATGSQFKIDSPFMKRFDVETECRALGIWPISLCRIPDSQLHIKNLQELVAKAIEHGKELPKDTPKVKRWYRVGLISGEVFACLTEQGEKSAEKYVGHRWITDRIEYDVM